MTTEGPAGPELNRQLVLESLSNIRQLSEAPHLDAQELLRECATLDTLGASDRPEVQPIFQIAGEFDEVKEAVKAGLTGPEAKKFEKLEALLGLGQPEPAAASAAPEAPAAPEAEDGERSRLLEEAERKLIEEAKELGADDPMVAFNLWQSETQPVPPRESPEARKGDQAWWQMTQAEFLEKYPDPNTPQAQRAAFALLHRMMLEDALLTYRGSEAWGNIKPEEVIAEYPDLQGQYEQAKSQVFEQPYEPVPRLSEEAKTKLENIFMTFTEATGSGDDDHWKRRKLSEEVEDQIKAILNLPNIRVAVSGISRRLNNLPLSLDNDFYQRRFKLAQKIFDIAPAELRQVFAIGQEAARVYEDSSPKYHARGVLNHLITRASGVTWSREKEVVERGRLYDSLRDNFYHGLTGKSYNGYLLDGSVADRRMPELGVLVQNFQGMNSAEVTYFQLANNIAQARENYVANLADQVGLKFIPMGREYDLWSLVEKILHRDRPPLTDKQKSQLAAVFSKLAEFNKQVDNHELPPKIRDKAHDNAERLKLQLAKALGLSGEENPVTEKTRQEIRIPAFTSWNNLELFMSPEWADVSNKLFAKASPWIQAAFNKARGGGYEEMESLVNLIRKEVGVEEAEGEYDEKTRQQYAYEDYLNKVLLPRASTVPISDLVDVFIDANILDNRNLRLRRDIDQGLNNYFFRLAQEAGVGLSFKT